MQNAECGIRNSEFGIEGRRGGGNAECRIQNSEFRIEERQEQTTWVWMMVAKPFVGATHTNLFVVRSEAEFRSSANKRQ